MKHAKIKAYSFLVLALLLCLPVATHAGVLQKAARISNVFVGPATYVARNAKHTKKRINEIKYWLTASTSQTLHGAALHEAGHALVAHKNGFALEYVQIQKRKVVLRSKKDGEDAQHVYEGLTKIKDVEVEKLKNDDLEKILCFLRGGGFATQIDLQNAYGDSSDQKQIAMVTEEIIKQNSSKVAQGFYIAKKVTGVSVMLKMISSPAYIAGRDFDFKAKKIQDTCDQATRKILVTYEKELYALTKALEDAQEDASGVKRLDAGKAIEILEAV